MCSAAGVVGDHHASHSGHTPAAAAPVQLLPGSVAHNADYINDNKIIILIIIMMMMIVIKVVIIIIIMIIIININININVIGCLPIANECSYAS